MSRVTLGSHATWLRRAIGSRRVSTENRGLRSPRSSIGALRFASSSSASAKPPRGCRASSRRCSQRSRWLGWLCVSTARRRPAGCCSCCPRRHHSLRRRRFFLGPFHQTLARRLSPPSSSRHAIFLSYGSPLVYPLRSSEPRFFPHLHHRTQFQALPHPRIPAHPAVLVLLSRSACDASAVDCSNALGSYRGRLPNCGIEKNKPTYSISPFLAWVRRIVFQPFTLEASWLHPPFYYGDLSDCDPCVHLNGIRLPTIISVRRHHGGRHSVFFVLTG